MKPTAQLAIYIASLPLLCYLHGAGITLASWWFHTVNGWF